MKRSILVCLTGILLLCFWGIANAIDARIVMDTWETGTIFETQDAEQLYHVPYGFRIGSMLEENDAAFGGKESIGVWISGWMLYDIQYLGYDIEDARLIDAPAEVFFSNRWGQEAHDFPKLAVDKGRVILYVAIEKEHVDANGIEVILKNLHGTATVTVWRGYGSDEKGERVELTIDFSQVHQREFWEEAQVTARITECKYHGREWTGSNYGFGVAWELIKAGNVSYWMISGEIKSRIPLYAIRGNAKGQNMVVTMFNDSFGCWLNESFESPVVIAYDEREPTYDEVMNMLKEAGLSCTFSPEPGMYTSCISDVGPYYYLPFDLSGL